MRRGLPALAVVIASLSCAATALATTVAPRMAIPGRVEVIAAPGETNTILWVSDTTYQTGILLSITDVTAPVRIGGDFSAECRKFLLRTALCHSPATGLIYLGDGNDTFTAPLNFDYGYRDLPQFTVFGGDGNDRILSSVQSDSSIDGGAGNDLIVQGSSISVHGGTGNDTIVILKPHTGFFGNSSFGCDGGFDTIALPAGWPTPADCERRISLPQALASLPTLPYLG